MNVDLPTGSGRLILDEAHAGAWNMAADERLLEQAAASGCTLRFYAWSAPTLSLGYFQSAREIDAQPLSAAWTCVRRASGGGALVHDQADFDLTYSVAVADPSRRASRQADLYRVFHQSLVEALLTYGITAHRCSDPTSDADKSFLCFQRHAAGDVLIGRHKVLGSAQRRGRDTLLQHGSVLLQSVPTAPQLPGLQELTGQRLDGRDLIGRWQAALNRHWPIRWIEQPWRSQECRQIDRLVESKFGHPAWMNRR